MSLGAKGSCPYLLCLISAVIDQVPSCLLKMPGAPPIELSCECVCRLSHQPVRLCMTVSVNSKTMTVELVATGIVLTTDLLS